MTGIRPPAPAALRAYLASTYAADGIVARIGRRPARLPVRWEGRDLVLLGACNPGGRRRPDGWNRRMTTQLRQRLHRRDQADGEGRLGRWSETMLLVAIPPAAGLQVARRFRQNGIVLLRDRRPARLILLA